MPARTAHAWWGNHMDGAATPVPTDMTGSATLLQRVRNDAGSIEHSKITDPAEGAQWLVWTAIAAGARADSDVAICYTTAAKTTLRAYWQDAATDDFWARESADQGDNWGVAWMCNNGFAGMKYIAADYQQFWVQSGVSIYWHAYAPAETGGAGASWGGAYTDPLGISCVQKEDGSDTAHVIFAADRRIYSLRVWHNAVQSTHYLDPPSDQTVAAAAAPRLPSLCRLGGQTWACSWVRYSTGTPTMHQETVQFSLEDDCYRFGATCGMRMDSAGVQRMSMAYVTTHQRIFCGHDTATHWTYHYALGDAAGETYSVTPVRYRRIKNGHEPGILELEFLDPTGSYRSHASRGNASITAGFATMNTVTLKRGWKTSAGDQTISLDPHYITQVSRSSYRDGGHVFVTAVDGFGLLEMTRTEAPLTYLNRSLAYIAADIVALAGLVWADDADAIWATVMTSFTINPRISARQALLDVLALAGAVAYVAGAGGITGRVLVGYIPGSTPVLGDQDEIEHAMFGVGVSSITSVDWIGDAVGYHSETPMREASQGRRFTAIHTDLRATTLAIATQAALYRQALADMEHDLCVITVPLRPDLEIWDEVTISANINDVSAAMNPKVVTRIAEELDTRTNKFLMQLEAHECE